MLVAGHQPNYLPYLGFFHKLARVDRFMIVDTAQFVKRGEFGWIHRNKLRTPEGWQWLSLPVITKGKREQRCCDAELRNDMDWPRKHWSAIRHNYRQAAHFARYSDRFEAIYQRQWTHLTPLSVELIRAIAEALEITTPLDLASEGGVEGVAGELLVNICRHYGAERYLSGIHGRDYLDEGQLRDAGIELVYQEFTHPVYRQCQPGDFLEGVCALDLLFNEGPRAHEILLGR